MPGYLLHVGATAICPHGGQVSIISSNTRVMVSSQAVATVNDTYTVAGCAFTIPPKPQPCVKVQWLVPASRVKVGGQAVILQASTGLCQSAEQIPQGPPNVLVTQLRVKGT
ncbi:Uncharacterised protein [uncultured archaeon]|nr:Uncharacterised protein [uncultured archaeon]